jgi:hypothetical protein
MEQKLAEKSSDKHSAISCLLSNSIRFDSKHFERNHLKSNSNQAKQ